MAEYHTMDEWQKIADNLCAKCIGDWGGFSAWIGNNQILTEEYIESQEDRDALMEEWNRRQEKKVAEELVWKNQTIAGAELTLGV